MSVFETTDPDRTGEVLTTVYGDFTFSLGEGRHLFRMARYSVGPVELQEVAFTTMTLTADVRPLGVNLVGRSRAGRVRHHNHRRSHDRLPGDVFLVTQPDEQVGITMAHLTVDVAVLPPDLLGQVATTEPGRSPGPVRLEGYSAMSPAGAAQWGRAYDFVRDHVAGTPAALNPLTAGAAARLLAATALTVFPSNAVTEPTGEDRNDAHPASLRRAIAFIEANPHRDVSAADIADAANVSLRALQLTFRRHLETSPMAYLRRVRLDHAHQDLEAAAPGSGDTVSGIAARWGFLDHSRFTAAYRAAYGRPPSRTLRS